MISTSPLLAALSALALLSGPTEAGPSPPAASQLLSRAEAATKGRKAVFVAFHASWCGWCRRLEKLLELPAVKPVFDRHFETVWLTVDERADRKASENPGADELRRRLGGQSSGLPFYAVFDSKGRVLARSVRRTADGRTEGIGFPRTPDEIGTFIDLLRAGAPRMTAAEEKTLREALASLTKR